MVVQLGPVQQDVETLVTRVFMKSLDVLGGCPSWWSTEP